MRLLRGKDDKGYDWKVSRRVVWMEIVRWQEGEAMKAKEYHPLTNKRSRSWDTALQH